MNFYLRLFTITWLMSQLSLIELQAQTTDCQFTMGLDRQEFDLYGSYYNEKTIPLSDGNYLVSKSRSGIEVAKVDASKQIIWEASFEGDGEDFLTEILPLPDGGFLLGGNSDSNASGSKSENSHGGDDYWVIKIDADGNKIWDKTFGGVSDDKLVDLMLLPDGGFLLGGNSDSDASGSKSEDSRGGDDYWVIKTDADGNKIWDKTLGGNQREVFTEMILQKNGKILIGGSSLSNTSNDKSENSRGFADYWLVALDNSGNKLWDKTLGGDGFDWLNSMILLPEGGFLLGGSSGSNTSGEKSTNGYGGVDYWIIKVDASGNKIWDKTLGSDKTDNLAKISALSTGGFFLVGESGDIDFPKYWFVEVDHQGNFVKSLILGGKTQSTSITAIVEVIDLFMISTDEFLISGLETTHPYSQNADIKNEIIRLNPSGENQYLKVFLKEPENINNASQEIKPGDEIDISIIQSDFFSLEIQNGHQGAGIGSMEIQLEGPINAYISDDTSPFTLFGDQTSATSRLLAGKRFPAGEYVLTVTPYCQEGLQGQGLTQVIPFTIVGNLPTSCTPAVSLAWDKTLGGNNTDQLSKILALPDGGFLLGGSSSSNISGEKSENSYGSRDFWVVRVNANQEVIWDKTFGGRYFDDLRDMVKLPDGNFLLGGNKDVNEDISDYWLIKIDADGNIIWEKTYDNNYSYDELENMTVLPDGSTLIGGFSIGGWWIIKIDTEGNIIWENSSQNGHIASAICPLPDGGFIVGGDFDHGFSLFYNAPHVIHTFALRRLDSEGNTIWEKHINIGDTQDHLDDLLLLPDGNILIGASSDDDASEYKSEDSHGKHDFWIIKIDQDGNKIWDKTIGGNKDDYLRSLSIIEDNILIGGHSESEVSREKSEPGRGSSDIWLISLDIEGNKLWDKTLGGESTDQLNDIILLTDGSIAFGGSSSSDISGEKSENKRGDSDFWLGQLILDSSDEGLPANAQLFLIDAQDDLQIQEIKEEEIIDVNALSSDELALVVSASRNAGSKVVLDLQGPVNATQSFSEPPYALFGLKTFDKLRGEKLPNGKYTLSIAYYCDSLSPKKTTQEFSFSLTGMREYVLVNADTEEDIQIIQEGDAIDLAQIGTNRLNVRLNFDGAPMMRPDSVVMTIESLKINHTQTERLLPYALFGGEPATNYYGKNFCPGYYTIKALAYLDGHELPGSTVNFQLTGANGLDIQTLTLVNAATDVDISLLSEFIPTSTDGISIRADVGDCVESVRFLLTNQDGKVITNRVENINPYALLGDTPRGNYLPWFPEPGIYTLETTAYSGNQAEGIAGEPKTTQFVVTDNSATLITKENSLINIYPNPSPEANVHVTFTMPWDGSGQLILRDGQGNIKLDKAVQSREVDLNLTELKPGYYILELQTSSGIFRQILVRN